MIQLKLDLGTLKCTKYAVIKGTNLFFDYKKTSAYPETECLLLGRDKVYIILVQGLSIKGQNVVYLETKCFSIYRQSI